MWVVGSRVVEVSVGCFDTTVFLFVVFPAVDRVTALDVVCFIVIVVSFREVVVLLGTAVVTGDVDFTVV